MDIEKYVAVITDAVNSAAELGDEQTRRIAAALANAVAAPARLAVLQAVSDAVSAVDRSLDDRTVTVRLDGTEIVVSVHSDPAEPHPESTPTFEEMTGDISRVTLRLVEQIKNRAEEAAAQSGVSLNSWVAQAVQGALREQSRYQRRADEWRWPGTPKAGPANPAGRTGAPDSTRPDSATPDSTTPEQRPDIDGDDRP